MRKFRVSRYVILLLHCLPNDMFDMEHRYEGGASLSNRLRFRREDKNKDAKISWEEFTGPKAAKPAVSP